MSKIDHSLFSAQQQAPQSRSCPDCGGQLQLKHSSNGSFWGCENYPDCHYIENKNPEHQSDQLIKDSSCPHCGHELAVKQGRYGLFIGCTQYPVCNYIADMDHNESTSVACPSCQTGQLIQRNSRHGKKFYACNQYPKCKYVVNDPPVAESCPDCGWALLVEKRSAAGIRYSCPQKKCQYKGRLLPHKG